MNVIVSFYTDTLFTQEIVPSLYMARAVFLRRRGKLDTYSGNLERGKSCMRENTIHLASDQVVIQVFVS